MAPPGEEALLDALLDGTPHLVTGPPRWNALGLGSTALHVRPLVQHEAHGHLHARRAARIVAHRAELPRLDPDLPAVVKLLDVKDDKPMPASSHPAFNPDDSDRWREIEAAWAAIGPMYWGPREPLIEATRVLRLFLDEVAGA